MNLSQLRFDTPLGEMIVIATDSGVRLIDFADRRDIARAIERVNRLAQHDQASDHRANDLAITARQQVREYFAGHRTSFDLPIDPIGTDFQNRCWQALATIPFGQTRSYTQQAGQIGLMAAVRAVAQANGQNFCAIVIPCHRVIGHRGDLRGYGAGIERKRWLIDHESQIVHQRIPDPDQIPSTLFARR
jgi:AraC family transcriptional regulator of adaptative response/methylated-DNA-[protein]-cysteine methyltransferase